MKQVFITGADRGLGLSLARHLAENGWRVYAGSYLMDWPELSHLAQSATPNVTVVKLDVSSDESVYQAVKEVNACTRHLDMIINNAGISGVKKETDLHGKQDYEELLNLFNVNALGALRVTYAMLPLLKKSRMKRLCYVSSEAGSISQCSRQSWYGYCMSKAALNMGVLHLFHLLRAEGYTFRLFHPGWMRTYMSGSKNTGAELEPDDVAASAIQYFVNPLADEERLVMRDWSGKEWPW